MHRTALLLAACLLLAAPAGAAGPDRAASAPSAALAVWLPLAQKAESPAQAAEPTGAAAARAGDRTREIVAGLLTGSLAAVLMLKLLYGRRRKDDSA